jgi:hypothetical protein
MQAPGKTRSAIAKIRYLMGGIPCRKKSPWIPMKLRDLMEFVNAIQSTGQASIMPGNWEA